MTANVITYRGRSAMREAGKVLGFPEEMLDRYSHLFASGDYQHTLEVEEQLEMAGVDAAHPRLPALLSLCRGMHGLPRHLGQHPGGMVLSNSRLDHVVPLENARMPGRVVLQWDKDDCEDLGIVKVDLLGLGMMAALQEAMEMCAERGKPVDLARLPKDDPATFEAIRAADTVGLFQIESRAQMATLPRMKPVNFYDLVVEVAIVRPGPIHGDAVNPYLARRAGKEPVTYPDERARPILARTLGVVLFQEQILQLAMELGGFTAAEADELRRAIGFTRSPERMQQMAAKLKAGLQANGVSPEAATQILEIAHHLRALRLSGEPCDQLRPDRLRERVAENAPACGILRGPAQLPADGILFPVEPGAGCAPPWDRGAASLPSRLRRQVPGGGGPGDPAGTGLGAGPALGGNCIHPLRPPAAPVRFGDGSFAARGPWPAGAAGIGGIGGAEWIERGSAHGAVVRRGTRGWR